MSEASSLKSLFDTNFLEYASYVIKERAIPFLEDGLKPVQRRILHTLFEVDDGKFHKVANVVGHTMRYHPHGDASIEAALVNIAQKNFLIDQQGNFGNILTGDPASAARYIECKLSPMARETLFGKAITEYVDSYDGRNQEPIVLPARVPVLLMSGVEGIAVGLSTRILPHNFNELLEAQISILRKEPFEIYPDFIQGGLVDTTQYQKGKGQVKVRAKIEIKDAKTLVIREVPFGSTTESLIKSIETAIHRGKLKISSINDYTTEFAEIELRTRQGVKAESVLPQLYLYTDCEQTVHLRPIVIHQGRPVEMAVDKILEANTDYLLQVLKAELEQDLARLQQKYREHILVQIFIENKLYQILEEATDFDELKQILRMHLESMLDEQFIPIPDADLDKLLNIPIRRISRFDSDKARQEIQDLEKAIAKVMKDLNKLSAYAIKYLQGLLKKFGKTGRRTELASFETVDVRKVATRDLTVGYDAKEKYIGLSIKSEQSLKASNFDRLLLFFKDTYRVINIPEKLFVADKIKHWCLQSELPVVSVLYRDAKDVVYMKRFKVEKYILEKDYAYLPEGGKLLYFSAEADPVVELKFEPKARSRVQSQLIDFSKMRVKGVASRGNKVTDRVIKSCRERSRNVLEKQGRLSDMIKSDTASEEAAKAE